LQLLAGLGNPGEKYRQTRHNAGFRFLDRLATYVGLGFRPAARLQAETAMWDRPEGRVLLIKPQTFMNESGRAVAAAARYYRIDPADIFIVFDDLDLPAGRVRLRRGGGHGGHNGLKSINRHLDDAGYSRIRIGIGRPASRDVTPWVLGRQHPDEEAGEQRVFDCLLKHVDTILAHDLALAANHIHLCLEARQDEETRKEGKR